MKIKSSIFAASVTLALGALPASAALTSLYSTNFNSPTYSNGGLIGQDSWLITGTSVVSPISVANTGTNGNVTLATTGQDVRRSFTSAVTSGSVFLGASITVGTAQATGDHFLHLGDGGANNFFARAFIRSNGIGFQMAASSSSGTPTYGTTVLRFGTTYQLLMRYDFVAGLANDTGALFINPTTFDGSGDTPYVAMTTIGTDATTISSVHLRQGGSTVAATLIIDNIFVAIPEPSSAMLLGAMGILGVLRRRR